MPIWSLELLAGLWIFDDLRPFREMSQTAGKVLEQPLRVFPVPDAYLAEFKSFQGYHFPAMAQYEGASKMPGANISIWNKPDSYMSAPAKAVAEPVAPATKGKKSSTPPATEAPVPAKAAPAKRPENAKVFILNAAGDTVRNFKTPLDTGLTRIYWGLERNGTPGLSRQDPRPDADPPGGPEVLPGTYKILVVYGTHKDSATVTVHSDPRIQVSMADLQAREAVYKDMEKIVKAAAAGAERLREASKAIKRVDTAMEPAVDSVRQQIAKLGKSLQDSIAAIEKRIWGEGGSKVAPYPGVPLSRSIGAVMQYMRSLEGTANQAVSRTMEQARRHTAEVLAEINAFFDKDFAAYQKKVEAAQGSLFKVTKPVSLY